MKAIHREITSGLRSDLTSPSLTSAKRTQFKLIRTLFLASCLPVAACGTWMPTDSNSTQRSEPHSNSAPLVDLSKAEWKTLTSDQPLEIPIRAAILGREPKIGATRAALKIPRNSKMPPLWFTEPGTFLVAEGTIIMQSVDEDGKKTEQTRAAGHFTSIPAYAIQNIMPNSEGIILFTIYGQWNPKLPPTPWGTTAQPRLRGTN